MYRMLSRRDWIAGGVLVATRPAFVLGAPSRNVVLYGRETPLPAAIELSAGPLTMEFEPDLAFLRYIRFGEREVLRGIYAAVRDKVWGTVAPKVSNVHVDKRAGGFQLTFDVDCKQDDIDFGWKGTITGQAKGLLEFRFDGVARSTFQRNRIGFCVLHPLKECAGQPCTVVKTDGSSERGRFPEHIAPHQPFKAMRSITHQVTDAVAAEVSFEGDVFEMEDHRNWTDGNYKTYCTPLERPFPVEVKQGERVQQTIRVKAEGTAPAIRRAIGPVGLRVGERAVGKLPAIGLGAGPAPLSAVEKKRLQALNPAHLRVDLRPGAVAPVSDWPVEAAVHIRTEEDLARFKAANVVRWLVFHEDERSTHEKWIRAARKVLKGAPVGSGTNEYFTELNRERPPAELIDLACYSINPQVHAFDNRSLVENLEPQAETVRSARTFVGSKPIAVTPVTLRPRFNPQAKGPRAAFAESRVDYRQGSLLGAAWTLGSIKYLAEAGASSVTYYETAGPAGVLSGNEVYPLYHVLADVNEFAGADVLPVESEYPLQVIALVLQKAGRRRMLVANLTPREQRVGIEGTMRRLDETTFVAATTSPEQFRSAPGEKAAAPVLRPYSVIVVGS
jgi:hypothetical protein